MTLRDHLKSPLGFGTAPLGNMFRDIPEAEAAATLQAAWDAGTRYFDTAPFYGAGMAESRVGELLKGRDRGSYVLSTKVGHLVLDEALESRDDGDSRGLFSTGNPRKVVTDYTRDGTLRSLEGSLERLGTDHVEMVFVHDLSPDFLGDAWTGHFEVARQGAFRVLDEMRAQGVIEGWGLGVNTVDPVVRLLELDDVNPNCTLLAGRYTLLDHADAASRLMGKAAAQGVEIIAGGPYSSGVLAGGDHFEYGSVPPEIAQKLKVVRDLCQRFDVPVKAAALHFSMANPAVASVIPGASKPERIAEDHAAWQTAIPAGFWQALRDAGIIDPAAPVPDQG